MARIYRDAYGVPHVRATSVADLAHGQGQVTARDRAWQLEFLRRRATGTTAEVFGPSGVPWDRLARRTGIADTARRAHARLAPETARVRGGVRRGRQRRPARRRTGARGARHRAGARGRSGPRSRSSTPSTCSSPACPASSGPPAPARCSATTPGCSRTRARCPSGSNAWAVGGAPDGERLPARSAATRTGRSRARASTSRSGSRATSSTSSASRSRASPASSTSRTPATSPGRSPTRWPTTRTCTPSGCGAWTAARRGARPGRLGAGDRAGRDDPGARARARRAGRDRDDRPRAGVLRAASTRARGLSLRAASSVLGDLGFDAILPLLRARTVDDVDARASTTGSSRSTTWWSPTGTARCATGSPAGCRSATTRNRRGVVDAADPATALDRLARPAAARTTSPPDGQVVTANERRGPESDRDRHHVRAAAPRRAGSTTLLDGRDDLTAADFARLPRRHAAARRLDQVLALLDRSEPGLPGRPVRERDPRAGTAGWTPTSAGAAAFAAWRSAFVRRLGRRAGVRPAGRAGHRRPGARALAGPDRPDRRRRRGPDRRASKPFGIDLRRLAARRPRRRRRPPRDLGRDPRADADPRVRGARADLDAPAVPEMPVSGDIDCVRCTGSQPGLADECWRGSVARYVWDLADRDDSGWVVPLGASGDPRDPHHHDQLAAVGRRAARADRHRLGPAHGGGMTATDGDRRLHGSTASTPPATASCLHSWVVADRARFWMMQDHTVERGPRDLHLARRAADPPRLAGASRRGAGRAVPGLPARPPRRSASTTTYARATSGVHFMLRRGAPPCNAASPAAVVEAVLAHRVRRPGRAAAGGRAGRAQRQGGRAGAPARLRARAGRASCRRSRPSWPSSRASSTPHAIPAPLERPSRTTPGRRGCRCSARWRSSRPARTSRSPRRRVPFVSRHDPRWPSRAASASR